LFGDSAPLFRTHAALQHDHVFDQAGQSRGKFIHLTGALGQQNGRTVGFDGTHQVNADEVVARLVAGQRSIQLVHFRPLSRGRQSKVGRSRNDDVVEWSRERLRLGVHTMANRPALQTMMR